MGKNISYGLIMLAVQFLAACAWSGAQRYIGQTLVPEDRHVLAAPSGAHTVRTNSFVLTDHYRIAAAGDEIHLSGQIKYTFDEDTHRLGAVLNRLATESIYIQTLFADRTGKVIAVEAIRLYPYEPIFYPVSFERTLSLPPGSEFMTYRLTSYFRDSGNRMVSRQINATETEETGGVDHGGGIGLTRGPSGRQSIMN